MKNHADADELIEALKAEGNALRASGYTLEDAAAELASLNEDF